MPPDEPSAPDQPEAWLRVTREDLALASARVPGVGFAPLCFHAQQAAEKAVKAVLLARAVTFPYVHDLGRLLDLCRQAGLVVPEDVAQADLLTDFATITRYPGNAEIGLEEYESGISTARAVVTWAEDAIGGRSRRP